MRNRIRPITAVPPATSRMATGGDTPAAIRALTSACSNMPSDTISRMAPTAIITRPTTQGGELLRQFGAGQPEFGLQQVGGLRQGRGHEGDDTGPAQG